MSFTGWPEEALDFYDGLMADNSKTYWLANKQIFDTCVLAPMTELLAELESEHGEGKIFRPYRDVRFSKDKSPYKTAMGAVVGDGYIQLSARGLAAGSGMWQMAADQLDRYRKSVADDRSGAEPRGYPSHHPRVEWLRCKGLTAWHEWPVQAWLGTRAAKKRITDFLTTTAPLNDWLAKHVGDSGLPPR
jgi:uncharacterized protein (DUF2461 family)